MVLYCLQQVTRGENQALPIFANVDFRYKSPFYFWRLHYNLVLDYFIDIPLWVYVPLGILGPLYTIIVISYRVELFHLRHCIL